MIFNSLVFLAFILTFFYLYWWTERKASIQWRNFLLIVGSYIFYGCWDWRFLSLIVISSAADYFLGLQIHRAKANQSRKWLLIASLCINLGILGFFKYFNFFAEGLELLTESLGFKPGFTTLNIILPVGISFYTFQTMSYTIDIYKRQLKPTRDPLQFFAFVAFFPQLVAGPIERAKRFLPQFAEKKQFNYPRTVEGLQLMLWGFFKKIVIADNFGVIVEQVYDQDPTQYSGLGIILATLLFTFQIYCDFSGYSDIAIGLGKILGFDLMINFKTPYFSKSFAEFWQRWHISLSSWFRDYVYIPLGGNRVNRSRRDLNIMITFLLSGLWHGANFTFVLWGFLHGLALVIEKKMQGFRHFAALLVFICCSLLWIPFRAKDLGHLGSLLNRFLKLTDGLLLPSEVTEDLTRYAVIGLVFFIFLFVEKRLKQAHFGAFIQQFSKPLRISIYYALLLSILFLGNFDVKPSFIYFQF